MSKLILTLLIFSSLSTSAQDSEPWFAFQNEDSSLVGFKDKTGVIKIEPKFAGFTSVKKFDDIIAVIEKVNDTYKHYYLTKNGKKIGTDSLYIFDNTADCESEGFIRFKDSKTEQVGMLDKNGDAVIPAEYNALSRVNNGLVVALKGAKKKYWDEHNESGCNHFSWTGGRQYLLNTNNEILIEDFDYDSHLDLFSLTIKSTPTVDSTKVEFQGKNGQYYSFTDHKKVFIEMLRQFSSYDFLEEDFEKICHDTIYYRSNQHRWVSEAKEAFVGRNFELIKNILYLMINNADYNIFVNGLNPYIYKGDAFARYFNNCGEAKERQYPVMNLVINAKNADGELVQDHFDFLKTDIGYRLLSISLQTGELK